MSDRRNPHVQKVVSGSGSTYGSSSVKRTITRLRPGALSPGGVGVDIKHNSYDRYLARIKGKAPLRNQKIPKTFVSPYIPFNRAYPIYGSKLVKTSIVNNCYCPNEVMINNDRNQVISKDEPNVPLNNTNPNEIFNINYTFSIGDIILAPYSSKTDLLKAKIIEIDNNLLTVIFLDNYVIKKIDSLLVQIFVYNRCNENICDNSKNNQPTQFNYNYVSDNILKQCTAINYFPNLNVSGNSVQNFVKTV